MGKEMAEPARTTVSQAPAQASPAAAHDPPTRSQVDRLAGSASSAPPDEVEIDNAKLVIMSSFGWMNDEAQQKIGDLKHDLEKEDAPPFAEELMMGALNVALLAGGAAVGEMIAGKLLGKIVEGGEPKHELVKGMFEQGIGAGVAAGRMKLGDSKADAIKPFIESQMAAVRGAHLENQTHWINVGRHRLTTVACSRRRGAFREREQGRYGAS